MGCIASGRFLSALSQDASSFHADQALVGLVSPPALLVHVRPVSSSAVACIFSGCWALGNGAPAPINDLQAWHGVLHAAAYSFGLVSDMPLSMEVFPGVSPAANNNLLTGNITPVCQSPTSAFVFPVAGQAYAIQFHRSYDPLCNFFIYTTDHKPLWA